MVQQADKEIDSLEHELDLEVSGINLFSGNIVGKTFEGDMLIRSLPTTLLQIFCKV